MLYFYLKALHIVFIVTWFAALFYMPRLFVYDIEARSKPEAEILLNQFRIMQRRLWFGIAWPSFILTLILGSWLAIELNLDLSTGWFVWKLGFVVLLAIYHIACHVIMNNLAANHVKFTSQGMRMWNEIPTVMLFGIVFLVVFKDVSAMWKGLLGLVLLISVLMAGIIGYKKLRSNKK
jgi:putative membrane protein